MHLWLDVCLFFLDIPRMLWELKKLANLKKLVRNERGQGKEKNCVGNKVGAQ